MTIRRYTIHPPQLVGRLSAPRPEDTPQAITRRLVGEWDLAMQELQRFLRYLMDANDTAQTGQGIVGVTPSGVVDHGLLSGLGDDDHLQYLTVPRHAAIDAADHASDGAAAARVLTADGAGNSSWEPIPDIQPRRPLPHTHLSVDLPDLGATERVLQPRRPQPHTHLGVDIIGSVAGGGGEAIDPRRPLPHTHSEADLLDVVTVSNQGAGSGLTFGDLILASQIFGP